ILGAGNVSTMGGGDATVIVDDYTTDRALLSITTGEASGLFRLAAVTFQGGNDGGTANTKWNGLVALSGNSEHLRVDHTHFNTTTYSTPQNGTGLVFYGAILGVTDHNVFDGDVDGVNNMVRVYQSGLYGGRDEGDESWAHSTSLGSSTFMFVEDNEFHNGI